MVQENDMEQPNDYEFIEELVNNKNDGPQYDLDIVQRKSSAASKRHSSMDKHRKSIQKEKPRTTIKFAK